MEVFLVPLMAEIEFVRVSIFFNLDFRWIIVLDLFDCGYPLQLVPLIIVSFEGGTNLPVIES